MFSASAMEEDEDVDFIVELNHEKWFLCHAIVVSATAMEVDEEVYTIVELNR